MARAKDPICGMSVDTEQASAKGVYGTETVYFCSERCKRTYESGRGGTTPKGPSHHP